MTGAQSYVRAKGSAKSLLSEHFLDKLNPDQLEDICWLKGVVVRYEKIDGSTGRICFNESGAIVTIDTGIREVGRRNFALAHELGHFLLHRHLRPLFICTDEKFLPWYQSGNEEPEANSFAANLLLPEAAFKHYTYRSKPSRKLISNCAEDFGTSITSSLLRYAEMGPEPCLLAISVAGKLRWFVKSDDFYPRLAVLPGMELSDLSCAGDYFQNGVEEFDVQPVDSSAWIVRSDYEGNFVNELCFYLKSYNTVASLVWLQ